MPGEPIIPKQFKPYNRSRDIVGILYGMAPTLIASLLIGIVVLIIRLNTTMAVLVNKLDNVTEANHLQDKRIENNADRIINLNSRISIMEMNRARKND